MVEEKKKIILCGYNGVMGQNIREAVAASDKFIIVAGIDLDATNNDGIPVYRDINDISSDIAADVIINFSHPSSVKSIAEYAKKNKIPLVEATTGLSQENLKDLTDAAMETPVLQSGNTSLGLNLMVALAKQIAAVIGTDWEYEIIEEHHRRKVDAPSGAALMIFKAINQVLGGKLTQVYDRTIKRAARDKVEVGISSIRGGNIVGTHTIKVIGENEILEVTHRAQSRILFADGALGAAEFILTSAAGQLYSMEDVIASHQKHDNIMAKAL